MIRNVLSGVLCFAFATCSEQREPDTRSDEEIAQVVAWGEKCADRIVSCRGDVVFLYSDREGNVIDVENEHIIVGWLRSWKTSGALDRIYKVVPINDSNPEEYKDAVRVASGRYEN